MKKLIATLVVTLALGACGKSTEAPGPADAATSDKIFDMPYLMRDLDNGLRVIVVQTDYPDIVTIQIPVQTGSRNEIEPGQTGFAHFFDLPGKGLRPGLLRRSRAPRPGMRGRPRSGVARARAAHRSDPRPLPGVHPHGPPR